MSLRDVMRKAAGLLVELPPESAGDLPSGQPNGPVSDKAGSRPAPDIDELLAVVRGPKAESAGKSATPSQLAHDGKGPDLDQIKSAAAGAVNRGSSAAGTPAGANAGSQNSGSPTPGAGPVVGADGKLKAAVVYEAAGVPPTPFSAEQALELIQALPAELPLEVRRQTVKATLAAIGKTLGASPQTIVADATRKATALEAYLNAFAKKSEEFVGKVEGEIKTLETQIVEKRKAIETTKQRVEDLSKCCDEEAVRLDDVLEFFSLDVGPSKYAADAPQAAPDLKKPDKN